VERVGAARSVRRRPRTLWETRFWLFPQVRRDPHALLVEDDRISGIRSDDLEASHTWIPPALRVALALSRALMQPIALALHLDDLGVCEEAIEDRGRRQDVAQELPPVLRWAVRCNQRRRGRDYVRRRALSSGFTVYKENIFSYHKVFQWDDFC
jgi:hypothetical protein